MTLGNNARQRIFKGGDNPKPQRALVISTLGDFFCLRAETMQNRLREAL